MNTKDKLAREAVIQRLIAGYPSWARIATQGHIDAFVDASANYSLESLRKAQERFHSPDGVPGRDRNSWPSASEFAAQARLFEPRPILDGERLTVYPIGALPPPGTEPLGPTVIELRGRNVNVSRLSYKQKMQALATGKLPEDSPRLPVTPRLQRI